MQHAGLIRAFVSDRAGFGHAVMVEDPGAAPELFQPRPECEDAAARFAGDYDRFDASVAQINLLFGGNLCESERVGGRAAENGRTIVDQDAQPRRAAQAAAGNAEAADLLRRFIREPEPDERAERKREEDAITRSHVGRAENSGPTLDHPAPAFRRVEPAEGRAGGAAGLMEARVAFERKRQVGAKRRSGALVCGDFLLRRERKLFGEFLEARDSGGHACPRKFFGIKRIGRDQRREQTAQLLQLRRGDCRTGGKIIVGHQSVSVERGDGAAGAVSTVAGFAREAAGGFGL